MAVMEVKHVPELAEPVGELWRGLQAESVGSGSFHLAAPLSSTPRSMYEWVADHAASFNGWERSRFVLMDEQVDGSESQFAYVPINDPASYEGFARRHLLGPLERRTGVVMEVLKPPLQGLSEFDVRIDLLILALGVHGNYANVMPGTGLQTGWHIACLTPEYRLVHTESASQSYGGAVFRGRGMSLGPQQVLAAGKVAVMIGGERKRALTKQLLDQEEFDLAFPLSIIHHAQVRDRVTVYIADDVGIAL
jgi:6-phosphogluconolactonase/glucosamine-6-phosphate isomerase/deaminase